MALQLAGGTRDIREYTAISSRQGLQDAIEDSLVAAGWTVQSGSKSTDVVIRCAAHPVKSYSFDLRMRSTTTADHVALSISDHVSAVDTHALTPIALQAGNYPDGESQRVYEIISTQYQFFVVCIQPGPAPKKGGLFCSMFHVPSYETATQVRAHLTMISELSTDTFDRGNFRFGTANINSFDSGGHNLEQGTAARRASDSNNGLTMMEWRHKNNTTSGARWTKSGEGLMVDAFVAIENRLCGQVWDSMLVNQHMPIDKEFVMDGNTWRVIGTAENGSAVASWLLVVA